jgi:hypothetical protein
MEQDLLLEKRRVEARLKAVRGEIHAAKHAQAEPLARPRKRPNVERCAYLLQAALVVWALRGDGGLAAQFVGQWRRRGDNSTPAWTKEAIVERGESLTAAARAALLEPTTARGQRALDAARKFLAEAQLQDWVRRQNAEKGLAPSNSALWERWLGSAGPEGSPAGQTAGASRPGRVRSRRQWLQRWGRRWRIRAGKFKFGDGVSFEILREKAPRFAPPGCPENGRPAKHRGPIPRPDSGRETRTT